MGYAFAFASDHKTHLRTQLSYNPQLCPVLSPLFLRRISQLHAGSWYITEADWSKASGMSLQHYHTLNWLWNKFFLRKIPSSRNRLPCSLVWKELYLFHRAMKILGHTAGIIWTKFNMEWSRHTITSRALYIHVYIFANIYGEIMKINSMSQTKRAVTDI